MMIQLNPTIPVFVIDKGEGYAIGWIDYSQEHTLLWIVAFNDTGEVWIAPNNEVRMQCNYSLGRTA